MKRTIVMMSLMMVTMMMFAIPAKRGMWQTLKLTNGQEVSAQMVGDEHGHWMQAADGTCYVMQGDNLYQQVDRQVLTAKREARMAAKSARRKAIYASTSDGLGKKGKMSMGSVPSIGSFTIPVVMVQFSDLKFKSTTTVAKMTRYYNEEGYHDESGCVGSVRDYFKAQSGGQFVPTFEVVGIVTLDRGYAYYGTNNNNDEDQHLDLLPGDVLDKAVNTLGIDFSKYVLPAGDSNHSTGVPLLAMFYAGKGEATEQQTTANSKYLWPCEWDDVEDLKGGDYHGVHFNSFFIGNELYSGGTALMGMGVFCHEFGHALGLPDFYCTDYSYSNDDAFGNWSIMDTGAYEGDSYAPIGYNAYEKSYMGWLELKEFKDSSEVTLQSPLGTAENSAYIHRYSNNETFIFENRQPGTFYPSSYGKGVLVTRIAYSYNQWSSNTLNNTKSKKRACVLTADGAKLYYSASSSNLYGGSKTSISTLKNLSGSSVAIDIKNIVKNSDGTIKLVLNEKTSDEPGDEPGNDPIVEPVVPKGDYLFYESFDDCNGTGGNDDMFSGAGVAGSALKTDNEGWTALSMNGANQCGKFGSSKKSGAATTPAFSIDGDCTLSFMAAPWGTDDTALTVSVTGDAQLGNANFTMKQGKWSSFSTSLTGNGVVKLTFSPTKRMFLDEVLVVSNTANGITVLNGQNEKKSDFRIFDLSGRCLGTDFLSLPHGIYVIGGRKVVK